MKKGYLVCYDISDPSRLNRVFRFMKGRGIHLQYSVFLCSLTWQQLKEIKYQLNGFINVKKDDIRIYSLPLAGKASVIGKRALVPEGVEISIEGFLTWKDY